MTDFPPLPLIGLEFSVADHVARAEFFLVNARGESDIRICNWLLMACVNSARAPVEIVTTEWDKIYKKGSSDIFLEEAEKKVRHFTLVATIRVHDFHRQAIQLAPGRFAAYGPIKLRRLTRTRQVR